MTIENDFNKLLSRAANTNLPKNSKNIALLIVIAIAIAFFSPHTSTNSGNIRIGNTINNINIQGIEGKKNQWN